ncbi:MAG: DUF748 domain-containing protein [Pseudomonadota bacterium]
MDIKSLKQNKWFKRALWTTGGIVTLWGLAWLVVPSVAKSQMEKLVSEQLGRKVTLGEVDFKPWSLELTVNDIAIARAENALDKSPQLAVKRIYIDAELQSLLRLAPVLDAVQVDAPQLSLTHLGGGHYDVDDILARLAKPSGQPAGAPLSFALYNLALSGGALDFTDKAVDKTHELRDLQIQVPFLSNLDSQRSVLVEPKLAFRLNGSQFDSSAQSTPFAQTHKSDATFKVSDLDLKPYLAYLPTSLPVKLSSAVLNADLKVAFEQSPKVVVKLSGTLQAGKVKLTSAAAQEKAPELLDFDLLKLTLTDVRPLEQVARLASVELHSANLSVHRNKAGQLNLAMLSEPQPAIKKIATPVAGTGASPVNDSKKAVWKVDVAKFGMQGSTLNWVDEGMAPAARMKLRDVTLDASGIALPFVQPVQFGGSASLVAGASEAAMPVRPESAKSGVLSFKGSATDQAANVTVTLADLPLAFGAPYLAQFMTPALTGSLNADVGVNWKASADPAKTASLLLDVRQLTLDGVALTQGKTSLVSVKKLQVEQAQIDLERQDVTVGKLSLTQPQVAVGRESDGRWMAESWFKNTAIGAKEGKPSAVAAKVPATPAKTWGIALQDVALEGGALSFVDKSVGSKAVKFDVAALSVGLKNFSTTSSKPFAGNVSAQIRTRRSEAGRLNWQGSAGLSPLMVQGKVEAVRVPVHTFEPYLADTLNIDLRRAEVSFKGRVRYAQTAAGPVVKVNGDTRIEDLQANTAASASETLHIGEELLSWKLLNLRGLDVALAPGTAPRVAVQETVLSDFFARLALNEKGQLNLQGVMKSSDPVAAPVPAGSASAPGVNALDATKVIASSVDPTGARSQNDAKYVTKSALSPVISFGPISLLNGRVHFSDRFIQPNYSTNLSELTGKLSAFSSESKAGVVNLADLEIRGRAEGTASLEILGKVNPLAKPLALDIKGKVRDLELSPLSPYSVRYAGYGIERGKLSVDVAYQVQPDGQLTASNKIVLNQLTFGDKVDGAPASLPVKLAVALLADRNGVIDINLPVSGSLNDPQFRLAPIVFKLIINLVVKAITSPFSLLANAFGGGGSDELSVVSFPPGSAALTAEAKPGLDKVAQALIERPALKMTVVGTASLEVEREAYKREQLKVLVQAEKRHIAVIKGASASASAAVPSEEAGVVSAQEYPALLKTVYRRADFAKPRNLIGMTKDIPVAEMEALLLAYLPATEEAMRELALQRGVAVRDYLATQKLPTDRLFLGAAKAMPQDAKWHPRAELNLTMP